MQQGDGQAQAPLHAPRVVLHLPIQVPHVWYRVSLVYPDPGGDEPVGERRVTGVSLPGTPAVVVGSNGDVAWGFTNTYGDWVDLVVALDFDGSEYKLFVNGIEVSSNLADLVAPSLNVWQVGNNYAGSKQGGFAIAEFSVFDRALGDRCVPAALGVLGHAEQRQR